MHTRFHVIAILAWVAFANVATGQAPPPPPTSPTLWSFLGIPQAGYKLHAQLFNRRGNHPGLEAKPPLKGIADPANLKSDVPAIKAAAEIKQAEDLKPQKIKAIKYLAQIGCGCYDKDEKVTKALLAAMDDCTEEVRLAAVQAVAEAASSGYCSQCKERSCCNEKIVAQLSKMAYDRDDLGCFVEPSERVREAAIEAMCVCCPDQAGPTEAPVPAPAPVEGSDRPPAVEGRDAPRPAQPPQPQPLEEGTETTSVLPQRNNSARTQSALRLTSSRRRSAENLQVLRNGDQPELGSISAADSSAGEETQPSQEGTLAPVFKKVEGFVSYVDLNTGLIRLQLYKGEILPGGTNVNVYHRTHAGDLVTESVRVVSSKPGSAEARPVSGRPVPKIARGDTFAAWR